MPRSAASLKSFGSSFIFRPSAFPSAASPSICAISRPWSEWAEAPAAICLARFLAAMVARVAPHRPVLSSLTLQGPIAQFLQHMPETVLPIGHGLRVCERVNTVEMSASAFSSIWQIASSSLILVNSFLSFAIKITSP